MTFISPLRRRFQFIAIVLTVVGIAGLCAAIITATGGTLIYSLDDPYIHLSLAENLVQGHYGINAVETASPSSSILYPFLLAAGLKIGLGDYAPLFFNTLGIAGTVWILSGFLFDATTENRAPRTPPLAWLSLALMLLAINAFALPLTGMEHTLHLLAGVMIVSGLARIPYGYGPGLILTAGLILSPLLRFEGLALSGAALLVIFLKGYRARAIITGAVIAAALFTYVMAMRSLGLPPLPSSVMVKSTASAAAANTDIGSILSGLAANLREAFTNRQAYYVAVFAVILLAGAALSQTRRQWPVAVAIAIASLAHIVAGRWGWFGRYEVYVITAEIAAILVVWRPVLSSHAVVRAAPLILSAVFFITAKPYIEVLKETPRAARWIHGQQFQMHRFATEFFPEVVAVNDLGWVSYQNDTYVLDLWGLGSEEARKLRAEQGHRPEWISRLANEKNAAFAMVFDDWFFGQLPQDWCRIAQMDTPMIDDEVSSVAFYLVDPSKEATMRDALTAFETTVPDVTKLTIYPCGG